MADAATYTTPSLPGGGLSAQINCRSASATVPPAVAGKRKTPSELRLEQLKRVRSDQNEEPAVPSLLDGNLRLSKCSTLRKHDASKPPRFVDTRVADVYAATKPGDRPKFFTKERQKDVPVFPQKIDQSTPVDMGVVQPNSMPQFQRKKAEQPLDGMVRGSEPSSSKVKDTNASQRMDSVPFSTFRDVTQISSGLQEASAGAALDLVKAFKGMAVPKVSSVIDQTVGAATVSKKGSLSSIQNATANLSSASLCLQGRKLPLDYSLKTSMRFTSCVSFQRYQRISNKDSFAGLQSFLNVIGGQGNKTVQSNVLRTDEIGGPLSLESTFSRALQSWVHPQSVLPSSVLSALASAAAHGSIAERDFLCKRQQMWEDAFCSLYYMFRNKQCDIFYFSTQQFLVMFIGGGFGGRDNKACSAFLTRSTRGLRGLLQEQEISFSMPLCETNVDTTTKEEIQELTEFEKSHPGQTRLVDSMVAVDNSPQSILAFTGHKSVHGLYDFLLNHRFFLSSTTGADVPILYSPVSFQNAALVMPEVICKKLQRSAEAFPNEEQSNASLTEEVKSSLNLSFSLELKGAILPPWVVWRVCTALQLFRTGVFEASLVTDPISGGLNIAQDFEVTQDAPLEESSTDTVLRELKKLSHCPGMRTSFVKHLKFAEGSYTADLATI